MTKREDIIQTLLSHSRNGADLIGRYRDSAGEDDLLIEAEAALEYLRFLIVKVGSMTDDELHKLQIALSELTR